MWAPLCESNWIKKISNARNKTKEEKKRNKIERKQRHDTWKLETGNDQDPSLWSRYQFGTCSSWVSIGLKSFLFRFAFISIGAQRPLRYNLNLFHYFVSQYKLLWTKSERQWHFEEQIYCMRLVKQQQQPLLEGMQRGLSKARTTQIHCT